MKTLQLIAMILITPECLLSADNSEIHSPRINLALIDFSGIKSSTYETKTARSALEFALFSRNFFALLEREKIDEILQASEAEDNSEITENTITRGIKSANFFLHGILIKNDVYILDISIIKVQDGLTLESFSEKFASLDDADDAAGRIAERIEESIKKYLYPEILPEYTENVSASLPVISASASLAVPVDELYKIVNTGFGFFISGTVENILNCGLFASIKSGLYFFPGALNSSDKCFIFPISAGAGWNFFLTESIILSPSLSGGAAIIHLKHEADPGFSMKTDSSATDTELIFELSFEAVYIINNNYHAGLGVAYSFIPEKDGIIDIISITAGIKYKFYTGT